MDPWINSTVLSSANNQQPWRPFAVESQPPQPTPTPDIDPNWYPFPLADRGAFEDLETLLSHSQSHRELLGQHFRMNSHPATRVCFLKFCMPCASIAHFKTYIHLGQTWLFTVIYLAWFGDDHIEDFRTMTQRFLNRSKAQFKRRMAKLQMPTTEYYWYWNPNQEYQLDSPIDHIL